MADFETVHDALDHSGLTGVGGASSVNAWKMVCTGNKTLTNNADTLIAFDAAEVDGGGSVIDLANERLVVPATGFYLLIAEWQWEGTAPNPLTATLEIDKNGSQFTEARMTHSGACRTFGFMNHTFIASLAAGDLLTMDINPGAVTGVVARGNAFTYARSSLGMVRIT